MPWCTLSLAGAGSLVLALLLAAGAKRGMARWSRRLRPERGQALVEFALVVPLMLVLVFAVVDFGRAYLVWVTLRHASFEAARDGSTGDTQSGIVARAQSAAGPYNDSNLSVSVSNAQGASGSDVVVTTTYNLQFITPLAAFVNLSAKKFTITSVAHTRMY
jgi:Flp pilus assembly protein TadG